MEDSKPHRCVACDAAFERKSQLYLHMKSHGREVDLLCKKCDVFFHSIFQYAQHKQMLQEENFVCNICEKVFKDCYTLKTHWESHKEQQNESSASTQLKYEEEMLEESHNSEAPIGICRCESCLIFNESEIPLKKNAFCNRKRLKPINLGVNQQEMHDELEGILPAKISKSNSSTSANTSCEYGISTQEKTLIDLLYTCNFCYTHFISKDALLGHQRNHMKVEFACNICQRIFKEKSRLLKHQESHMGVLYVCNICYEIYKYIDELTAHQKIHMKEIHVCSLCSRQFPGMRELSEHQRDHLGILFTCKICLKVCNSIKDLLEHCQLMHHRTPNASCSQCLPKSKNTFEESVHKESHEQNLFSCGLCQMNDLSCSQLLVHDQPHSACFCKLCVTQFTSVLELIEHQRIRHTKFICCLCAKHCGSPDALLKHERLHPQFFNKSCELNVSDGEMKRSSKRKRNSIPLVCPICHSHVRSQHDLIMHDKLHRKPALGSVAESEPSKSKSKSQEQSHSEQENSQKYLGVETDDKDAPGTSHWVATNGESQVSDKVKFKIYTGKKSVNSVVNMKQRYVVVDETGNKVKDIANASIADVFALEQSEPEYRNTSESIQSVTSDLLNDVNVNCDVIDIKDETIHDRDNKFETPARFDPGMSLLKEDEEERILYLNMVECSSSSFEENGESDIDPLGS